MNDLALSIFRNGIFIDVTIPKRNGCPMVQIYSSNPPIEMLSLINMVLILQKRAICLYQGLIYP